MTRFMLCVLAVLCAPLAFAQSLTPAQMAGVRSAACADTNTARPMMLAGDANALIGWLNADSTFVVWRTRLTRDEATGDGFDWAQADNLTTGQARIWEWLFDNDRRATNPSSASVRAGISEAWKGTAAKLAVASAGDIEYRCVYVKNNHGSLTLTSPKVWIQANTPSGDTTVEISLGTSAVNGTEQMIADENTSPTGTSFSSAANEGAGLSLGDLAPGATKAVWIKRIVTAAAAAANDSFTLRVKGDTLP